MQNSFPFSWLFLLVVVIVFAFFYKKFKINIFLSITIASSIVLFFSFSIKMGTVSMFLSLFFLAIIIEIIHYIFFVAVEEEPYISKYQQINHHGRVIKEIKRGEKGQVLLDAPLLGDEIWSSISEYDIKKGERVVIDEIRGQILFVKKEK